MALDTTKGGVHRRRPSLRGIALTRVVNGVEVTQKWPKKRGKNLHPKTKEQNEYFRQVQWAFKFSSPIVQQTFTEAVKGTPLMPRDLFLMCAAGRFAVFVTPDGRKMYPMAGIMNVSESLDWLAQLPGSLLVRGEERWEALTPGPDGWVVTSVDGMPQFAPPTGGGGGGALELIQKIVATGTESIVTFPGIPQDGNDLELRVTARADIPTERPVLIRMNGDASAKYDYERFYAIGGSVNADNFLSDTSFQWLAGIPGSDYAAGLVTSSIMNFMCYTSPTFWKQMTFQGRQPRATSGLEGYAVQGVGQYRSADPVTSISCALGSGHFVAGSTFTLYKRT